jgi:hypothetical protein
MEKLNRLRHVRYEFEEQLRGWPLLAHGATGVATVARKLNGRSCIFTVLAAVLLVLSNQTIARWMFTFLQLFLHEKVSPNVRFPFRFSGSLNSLTTGNGAYHVPLLTCGGRSINPPRDPMNARGLGSRVLIMWPRQLNPGTERPSLLWTDDQHQRLTSLKMCHAVLNKRFCLTLRLSDEIDYPRAGGTQEIPGHRIHGPYR